MAYEEKVKPNQKVVMYWGKLASEWEHIGKPRQARDYYLKAHEASIKIYGDEHKYTRYFNHKITELKGQR